MKPNLTELEPRTVPAVLVDIVSADYDDPNAVITTYVTVDDTDAHQISLSRDDGGNVLVSDYGVVQFYCGSGPAPVIDVQKGNVETVVTVDASLDGVPVTVHEYVSGTTAAEPKADNHKSHGGGHYTSGGAIHVDAHHGHYTHGHTKTPHKR